MKIVLAGVTGFIGTPLAAALKLGGHAITILTRSAAHAESLRAQGFTAALWDGHSIGGWANEINGADAVINLAGEPLAAKRWSSAQKRRILESRVEATRALVSALAQSTRKPSILINASAVGFYGHVPDGDVVESSPRGTGFLADVCAAWEQEVQAAQTHGTRVVCIRIGVVLGPGGGALAKMIPPFNCFAGGPLGSGRQWLSWIHRDDAIGAIIHTLNNKDISGPVNLTAPEPATMKQFCAALGRALHRPSWAPVPAFILRLILGEMADMLLEGQKALPIKLQATGYTFQYPQLDNALASILRK